MEDPAATTQAGDIAASEMTTQTQAQETGTSEMTTQTDGTTQQTSGALGNAPDDTKKVKASLDAVNPIDIYRKHIAEALAPIVGMAATEISSKIQRTQTQDKGDLMLPVPALRIPGKKPNELATEWAEKVCKSPVDLRGFWVG